MPDSNGNNESIPGNEASAQEEAPDVSPQTVHSEATDEVSREPADNASEDNSIEGSIESDSAPEDEQDEQDELGLLRARVEELEEENSDLKDQFLRKSADFENYRRRALKEKEEMAAYSNQQLLLDIVPIIDDFERAIRSADESQDFDAFHNGVVLIEKQFTSMLERKWGLRRFDSEGETFDPQKHEAVASEDSSEIEEPVVVADYQKGYMLNERVLRSAKVKVAMPTG